MRKKSIFLFLSVMILGVCTTLGFFNNGKSRTYAQSTTTSVWYDGTYETEVDETDFYTVVGSGGTNMTTHHILTANGFSYFAQRVTTGLYPFMNESVVLDCDIDLNGNEWAPIGYDEGHAFKGTFDGNGHYIYNLKVTDPTASYKDHFGVAVVAGYAGLFGYVTGSISNLNLKNVYINVNNVRSVGSLAGDFTGVELKNISAGGEIIARRSSNVGGVVGESSLIALRSVSNILSSVDIETTNGVSASTVGGVFGQFLAGNGIIEQIAFNGSINANANYAGGLLGQIDQFGDIKNSYNVGSVSNSGAYTAGLIGNVNGTTGGLRLTNLYNAGNIAWKDRDADGSYAAGLFGLLAKRGTKTVSNCFNLSTPDLSVSNNSPIYGNENGAEATLSGVWFNVDAYSTNQYAVRNMKEMAKNKSFYSSDVYFGSENKWDFENVWAISSGINNSLPYLRLTQNLGNANNDNDYSTSKPSGVLLDGEGTFENPYLIRTAADLGYISANYSKDNEGLKGKYYSLQNDIDLSGKTWQPIGISSDNAFSGVFDGNGHTIFNMTCSLQFQYSYHGLFGVTSGAVIKNLTISDVRFINGGTEKAIMGSFIGSTQGETYLVNCVDNSGIVELKAVGDVQSSSLTIVYGKENLVEGKIKELGAPISKIAYDVEVEGNGGTFYGKGSLENDYQDTKAINGTYRLMIGADGQILSQLIDAGWGTSLPVTSENFGKEETIIKRGYKIANYSMLAAGSTSTNFELGNADFGLENSNLIFGLSANFEKKDAKNIQVVYNQYEVENFAAGSFAEYVRSKTFEVEYDAVLCLDYPEIFNSRPTKDGRPAAEDGNNLLRGNNFSIEGFYFRTAEEGLFGKAVNETAFANDAYLPDEKSEIYVKWVGSGDVKYQFNVVFEKSDDPIFGKIENLADVIDFVSLQSYGQGSEIFGEIKSFNTDPDGKVRASFEFDTTHSDLVNNGLTLKIKIKAGYEFAQRVEIKDFSASHDLNFGHLAFGTESVVGETIPTQSQNALLLGENFRNLDEDYSIIVVLQRKTFETDMTVSSSDIYFAVAPSISNVSSLSIFPVGFDGDPSSVVPTTKLVGETFIGYDVLNKAFVSSLSSVGIEGDPNGHAFDMDMSAYNDVLLGYDFEGALGVERKYFKFEKSNFVESSENGQTNTFVTYTLFEVVYQDGEWQKIDLICRIFLTEDGSEYKKISYLTQAEFSLLASVKNSSDDTVISRYDNFGDGSEKDDKENAITLSLSEDETGMKKLRHDIKIETIAENLTNQIGIVSNGETFGEPHKQITLVSKYTKVSFDWGFVDREGNEIVAPYAPTATFENGLNYEILAEKKQPVQIKITSSDYYRFFEFKDNGTIIIKMLNKNITGQENVIVSAEAVATSDDGISEEDYIRSVNRNNENYFGTGTVSKNDKEIGYVEASKNAKDTYEFSIVFGGDKAALRAGKYNLTFVCEPIDYSIDFGTKFVEYKNNSDYSKEDFIKDESGAFTTEGGEGNAPKVEVSIGENKIASGYSQIRYNSQISSSTSITENKAYKFYDWYVEGERWSGFLRELDHELGMNEDIQFIYSDLYYSLLDGVSAKEGFRDYNLAISAVYIKKEIHLSLNDRVSVQGSDVYVSARSLGLEISLGGFDYSYGYDTARDSKLDLTIKFDKSGTNGDSYYFSGFIVLNASNEVVKQVYADAEPEAFDGNGVFKNNYSIKSFMIDRLENDETLAVSTSYTVVPVITRKTATVYVLSGTGAGLDGQFTDGRNGEVYYLNGGEKVNTSNTIITIGMANVGDSIYLNSELEVNVDGMIKRVVVDSMFTERTGYTTPANGYWNWSNGTTVGTLNGSQIYISSSYFDGTGEYETSITLAVYRVWTPNTYTITFVRNQGLFTGANSANESVSITVTYDQKVTNALTAEDIAKVGYSFAGWTYQIDSSDQMIFDADGASQVFDGVFDEDGNFVATNGFTVYAYWTPKTYIVELVTNGANTIAGNEAEDKIQLEVVYGTSFADVFSKLGLSGGENSPKREGFIFNEVYVNGIYKQTITSATIFSETLPGCVLKEDGTSSLTLYIDWIFDPAYLSLSLSEITISKTYTANDIIFNIAEYFKKGFEARGYIVDIVDDQTVSISLNENVHAEVKIEISSTMVNVLGNGTFSVRDAGRYSFSLILSIEDKIIEGTTLFTQNINLYAQVESASLSVSISMDSEEVWLVNVKKIMSRYLSTDLRTRLENCNTFNSFVNNILKSLDDTIPERVTNRQAYEFVMYKYYYMTTSRDFVRYKNMTYEQFETVRAENSADVENVIDRLYFFDFYDHNESGRRLLSRYNEIVTMTSSSVADPKAEVAIDRIEIAVDKLSVDNFYFFRAVIKNSDAQNNLNNYTLNFDENGEAYIYLGQIYILPELLEVESLSTSNSTYFNANALNVAVAWQGDRPTLSEEGYEDYVQIDNNLYAKAQLYTSNIGRENIDTDYTFTSLNNYLYYADVSVVEVSRDSLGIVEVRDVSSKFKFVLPDDYIFTILNIDGVAKIDIDAKYLTFVDGFMNFGDLPNGLPNDLLMITQITYDLNDGLGVKRISDSTNGLALGAHEDEGSGILVAQIERNNSNSVSVTLSKFVLTVSVVANEKSLSEYIALYKWADSQTYNIDGSMEANTSFTIDKTALMTEEGQLASYNFFAVYTDMVLVSYNLNFPSNFIPESPTTSWLKLGQSTIEDLLIPNENGFRLASLTLTKTGLSYESIFDGSDGKFKGIVAGNRHAKVELEAKWAIEEIDFEQSLTEYKTSVYGFDYLSYESIVNIFNKNENLFNYTYEWYKGEELVSRSERLVLANNGSFEESGEYKLIVIANVKKEFLSTALVSAEGATNSIEASFTMEFIKNKLNSISFVGETEFDYNAGEHINDWHILIEYAIYDTSIEDYSENDNTTIEYYAGAKNLNFVITKNGQVVTSMKDAGVYTIMVSAREDVYSNALSFEARQFVVTIKPFVVEMSEYEIKFTKNFNGKEPSLARDIYLSNETVTFEFKRPVGEDVGNYDLTLVGISEGKKDNYILKMNSVIVFENGKVTEAGKTISVGAFEIVTSGTLRLSYEITETNPQTIEVGYSAAGYRVELDGFNLKIFNGNVLQKTLSLSLYDEVLGENVSSSRVLGIISEKFKSININFFDTEVHESVVLSGTYTYSFSGLEEISKYFSNVVFAQGYQFVVGKIIIDSKTLPLNKVYNGLSIEYFSPTGTRIDDINNFVGVYVMATYESAHAGVTRVELSLHDTNESEEVSNYQLSEGSYQATISKLSAKISVNMTKSTYEYGEISIGNIADNVDKNYVVLDLEGNDVSALLSNDHFRIDYSLLSTTPVNANGYVYKGSCQLQAISNFDDFYMTLVLPTVVIVEKRIEKGITVGQFTILASETIASAYSETYTFSETGDTFNILYSVVGVTTGNLASVGFYDLRLAKTEYLTNGSIVVSIVPEVNNQGFEIKTEDDLVYIILDQTMLNGEYNGLPHNFSVDLATRKLVIENNGATKEIDFSLELASDGSAINDVDLQSLQIFSGSNTTSFVDAGTYRLAFKATSSTYSNFAFKSDYSYSISKKLIDASKLESSLTRTYSGLSTFNIDDFEGKIGQDGVVLVVKFESADVGDDINVTIFLQGEKSSNYELTNTENLKGKITKADAYVELSKTEFVYGALTSRDRLPYIVVSNGFAISASQYELTLVINDATYSPVGYLECDTYSVTMDEGYSSRNYNLIFASNQSITVSQFSMPVVLSTSGQYTYIYGASETTSNMFVGSFHTPLNEAIDLRFTREFSENSGREVGYYKVLSATSISKNYTITDVTDRSEGAFRIAKAQEVIYILMSTADVVSGADKEIASIVYDGNLYDTVSVAQKVGGRGYQLVFESSLKASAKQYYDLSYYSYDAENDEYTKLTDVTIDNLRANIVFANGNGGKNFGEYLLNVQNATADNFSVVLGKYGLQNFNLNISKREVYFLNSTISKVFDNQDAEMVYENVSEMLEGVLEEELDSISLSIKLTEGGKRAKYVGDAYDVEAVLVGGQTNYNLNLCTKDGALLVGKITPAELVISVKDQTFVYGEEIRIDATYSADIDLNRYEKGVSLTLVPVANPETDYSTSGSLKVGQYSIHCLLNTADFKPVYVSNDVTSDDLSATITILEKQLTLEGVNETLEQIFTKTYDGSNEVALADGEGNKRLNIIGVVHKDKQVSDGIGGTTTIHAYDDVKLALATYATEFLGQSIQIRFTLGGDDEDCKNYYISPYEYGVIEAVVVKLNFNYNADGANVKSNVESSNLPQLSSLAYPFMSDSYLTSNSASASTTSTRNFPTNLTGKTGFVFEKWTMSFKNIAVDSAKYTYLSSILSSVGLVADKDFVYADEEFKINVGNNAETVALLRTLLSNDIDLLDTYYKNHENITFTFDANWNTNKYQVSIKVADENGVDASYGKVFLETGDGNRIEITSSFSDRFDYGTRLTLLAVANEHCTYYGFYNATGSIHYDNGGSAGVSVSTNSEGVLLTVNSLSTTYGFVARFEADKVDVVLDLSDSDDATISSKNFVKGEGDRYTWKASYIELQDFTLADIGLHRDGFTLTSISDGKQNITDFANTKISQLVSEGQTSIVFTPEFVAVGVVVTLDFADGETPNKNITVAFKSAYGDSEEWSDAIENPIRTGYNFDGWFNADGLRVTGQSILTTTERHTLTAKWTLLNFDLTLKAENVLISSLNHNFTESDGVYKLFDVDFDTKITFTVTANTGYELRDFDKWNELFIATEKDGVVTISFAMPANDLEAIIYASAKTNTVTILGENLGQILAYEVAEQENSLTVKDAAVEIDTGRTLKLVVSAAYGFQMIETYICNDSDAKIETNIENDVLTITVSSILRNMTITLSTLEVINDITIKFDDSSKIESFMVDGYNYNNLDTLAPFRRMTGEVLEMYVKYKHGFEFDNSQTDEGYLIEAALATEGNFGSQGYFKIVVSNIETDGKIVLNGKRSRFTLNVEVLSYDENKQLTNEPGNKVIIAENSLSSIEVDYESIINISYEMLTIYNFAGWSKDGENVFSIDEMLSYKVEQNETIYAIFSSMRFTIQFGTYNNFTLYSEYSDPSREKNIYQEISGQGESFVDAESGNSLKTLYLYYGASKTIRYVVPTGYRFYGYGYYNGKELVMLDINETDERTVDFTISSLDLDEDITNFVLYVIVKAYSFNININTAIDIDGEKEENIDVGGAELQGENGQRVNAYGYVDGTRTRYSAENFIDGVLVDDRQFKVIGFTGENVYIKVSIKKAGYKFLDIISNNSRITISEISRDDTAAVFMIRGMIGGTELDVDVLFKPNLNDIKIGFKFADADTDGGSITYATDEKNKRKVFASGRDYSSIVVAAYTDSSFEVFAYVRTGFYIDENNIQIVCGTDIIDKNSVTFTQLSMNDDGYTGRLRFIVRGYLNKNEIYIHLKAARYTVKLVEEGSTLAIINNVEYGSRLNLYQSNQENIQIVGDENSLKFVDGKLEFVMQKPNYHFEGFFTSENGAGVMYIDTNGMVLQEWRESGYILNSLTSKYELTENAYFNEQTQEMEITLYLYWSYYKTRIKFELVPDTNIDISAQDMITGVDYTNSWYYPTSKYYIEVAFNTNIYINAPTINGYKFYKFIIKQRDINGNWLEDVVTFSEEVPWSTNELDKIVECDVQIVYFAQVEVVVYGGEGGFTIDQSAQDAKAGMLNKEHYVDTTKPFTLMAEFDENNYEFIRWNNVSSGQSWWSKNWEGLRANDRTTLILNLQGRTFQMTFADERGNLYDYTFGQVLNIITTSTDNNVRMYRLGAYSISGEFVPSMDTVDVRVGDLVTFVISVDYGFAPIWGRDDITFTSYADGLSYYDMKITSCPPGDLLRIMPEFKNEVFTIYIDRDFVEKDKVSNAIDLNTVSLAGYAVYGNKRTDYITVSADIDKLDIKLVVGDRYKISSIVLKNYDKIFANKELFVSDDGNISLSKEFLQSNEIVGTIRVEIRYERFMWSDHEVQVEAFKGLGTDEDPYEISTIDDLVLMMRLCNTGAVSSGGVQYRSASYILMNNLELSDKFWTPIGTIEYSFNGYFNFNGHKITGIFNALIYDTVSYGGLFGVISANAEFVMQKENIWYIYLIVGIVSLLVIIVIVLIIVGKRRKKRREMLANK